MADWIQPEQGKLVVDVSAIYDNLQIIISEVGNNPDPGSTVLHSSTTLRGTVIFSGNLIDIIASPGDTVIFKANDADLLSFRDNNSLTINENKVIEVIAGVLPED